MASRPSQRSATNINRVDVDRGDHIMNRRTFLHVPLAGAAFAVPKADTPNYHCVTAYKSAGAQTGMPGPYPGRLATVHSPRCINEQTRESNREIVREMIDRGLTTLTGDKTAADAWRRLFNAKDVVGIKVNCSGAPKVCSDPNVVGEIARNLVATGVKPSNIFVYERFPEQLVTV